MNTQEITLDVSKQPTVIPTVYLGQGDKSGTILKTKIYDNGQVIEDLAAKTNAKLAIKLPGGDSFYEVNARSRTSAGVAEFLIDETYAAAVAGVTDVAYVKILEGSTVIASTNRFRVVVLESASDGVPASSAYSNDILEATEAATTAASNANDKADAANTAAGRANSAADEAEAFLQGFIVEYSNLSDECKAYIAESASTGVQIATEEDMEYAFTEIVAPAIAGGNEAGRITQEDYEQALAIIFG